MANRWWIYQRERFPVVAYGLLVAVFSLSALTYSALVRAQFRWPEPGTLLVASACAFLFFLQLRIFDEWKDYEDDRRYRPYRAVPRGLITLGDLRKLWVLAALVQLALVVWTDARLVALLLVVWGYMGLMEKEFFVREWLKAHPVCYLWSHMLIMPLIYLFVTACDPGMDGAPPWQGLLWFLLAGFFNGVVIEIGRKIRAPEDEENGVETYSALWGRRNAVRTWVAALALSALGASLAAQEIHFPDAGWILGPGLGGAAAIGGRFLKISFSTRAKAIEHFSSAWTLLLHFSLGPAPLLFLKWSEHARH
jgi:4-hydroxybenzoate polyprenyltransferase